MPYCTKCGSEVDSRKKFCTNCGAQIGGRLKEQDATVQSNVVPGEVKPVQQNESASKKRSKVWRGIKIVAVVSATWITILFLYGVVLSVTGGIPVYPGATEFSYQGQTIEDMLGTVEQDLPAGWSVKMYQTAEQVSTVMDWYRDNTSGWEIVMDESVNVTSDMEIGYLCFTKSDDAAFVISTDLTVNAVENHYLIIMTGPAKDIQDIISGNF